MRETLAVGDVAVVVVAAAEVEEVFACSVLPGNSSCFLPSSVLDSRREDERRGTCVVMSLPSGSEGATAEASSGSLSGVTGVQADAPEPPEEYSICLNDSCLYFIIVLFRQSLEVVTVTHKTLKTLLINYSLSSCFFYI